MPIASYGLFNVAVSTRHHNWPFSLLLVRASSRVFILRTQLVVMVGPVLQPCPVGEYNG